MSRCAVSAIHCLSLPTPRDISACGHPSFHPALATKRSAPQARSHRLNHAVHCFLRAGNRGATVARRQDRHRGAIAVAQALAVQLLAQARTGSSVMASVAGAGIDTSTDARLIGQRGMHAGTGGGQPADERRLLAHGTDRRLRQIVHLPGQQARNAAGEKQRQVGGRIVGLWACLAVRRDGDDDRRCIDPPQRGQVVGTRQPILRLSLAHDQMGRRQPRAPFRSLRGNGFAVIQVRQQHRAGTGVDAGHLRTDVGQQSTANRGSRTAADLNDLESTQQRHASLP